MTTKQTIYVWCYPGVIYSVQATVYPCGLAYHRSLDDARFFVVTHLMSGKLLTEATLASQQQAQVWVELLKDAYDWWFLDVEPCMEEVIDRAWQKAKKS